MWKVPGILRKWWRRWWAELNFLIQVFMSNEVISALRSMIEPYHDQLKWKSDTPDGFYTDTTRTDPKGKPEFFASAQVRKNAVSFYLMPVYCYPELLDGISADLKKRMQGKSCFNFKKVEPALFSELEQLVQRSYHRYASEGRI
jgi:hypothetical protein